MSVAKVPTKIERQGSEGEGIRDRMLSNEMSFLYDKPGPIARRRIRVGSILSLAVLASIIFFAAAQFASYDQFNPKRWGYFLDWAVWSGYLLPGLGRTIFAGSIVAVLGFTIGLLVAVVHTSASRLFRVLARAYMEFGRTVPALLLVYVVMFVLPQPPFNLRLPTIWQLVIPLTIGASAVFAEIIRSGLLSLPLGQRAAAESLGLRNFQTLSYVLLPQAIRSSTPALVGQLVGVFKDTALGFFVGYIELLASGKILINTTQDAVLPTYIIVALLFLIVNGSISYLALRLRGRQQRT